MLVKLDLLVLYFVLFFLFGDILNNFEKILFVVHLKK